MSNGKQGAEEGVVGNNGKPDLDAILEHQGHRVPTFGHSDLVEKENVYVGNDEELLDLVADMPLHSQQPGMDDEMDALLELEADMFMGDIGALDQDDDCMEEDNPNQAQNDVSVVAEEKQLASENVLEGRHQVAPSSLPSEERKQTGGILKDRNMIPPQKDAFNATERYMTVTATSGEGRVYAPLYTPEDEAGGCLAQSLRRSKGSLLARSIEELLGIVEKEHFERALRATKEAKRKKKASEKSEEKASCIKLDQNGLWVDKYAPKSFLDLLSDELINRDVVKWLKMWDHCVFGKSSGAEEGGDPYRRPEQKIILLAGPPGLGKTTLAHIVARHCGYKSMEINASDERNGPALMSKVTNAMEMASVIGENRPNCIIIDEIDGASGGSEGRSAISALVKLANAKPVQRPSHKDDDSADDAPYDPKKKRSSKRSIEKPLTRPIICICNDLYAPVLRPLRDVAKVFVMRPPGVEKLVERLRVIAKKEKLITDKSTLRGLVERTECDIRSCLNTMQFIARKKKSMKMSDISSVGAGQKDVSIGIFRLWKDLLHLKKGPAIIGQAAETESQRCLRQYNAVADFADQDLVLGGLFESLPSIILFDMALLRTSTVLENMISADILQTRISRTSDFSLMAYLPAFTLRVGHILSGPENPSVYWPRTLQGSRRDFNEKTATLHKWRNGMGPESYVTTGKTSALLDVIPFIPWLVTPNLRPVSRHLYSQEEKKSLGRLVDAMIGLGISFSLQENDDTEQSAVEFNPPLQTFWEFSHADFLASDPIVRPREISVPIRQMITHELDMEKIRRNARFHVPVREASTAPPGAAKEPSTRAVPMTLAQRLEENKGSSQKSSGTKTLRKRNWLDQLKSKNKKVSDTGVVSKKHRAEDMAVLYKFHEGYTNAVKKPVKISQL